MTCIDVEFLYPPALLFPNKGGHWTTKQKTMTKYRSDCHLIASQYSPEFSDNEIAAHFKIWTTRKNVDLDNVLAASKRGIDSFCKAWSVDDKMLNPITLERMGTQKGGKILITFSQK